MREGSEFYVCQRIGTLWIGDWKKSTDKLHSENSQTLNENQERKSPIFRIEHLKANKPMQAKGDGERDIESESI